MISLSIKQLYNFVKEPTTNNSEDIIELKGWIRSKRDSKAGVSFIALYDGSCFETVQIVIQNTLENYVELLNLTKDCSIIVQGKVVKSLGAKQAFEILAQNVSIVGLVLNPDTYPISPKPHSVEFLREVAHLRPRTNLISAITRVRNTISFAIHEYFQQNDFFWIHTPLITGTDAEGAGELFRVTTLDMLKPPQNSLGMVDFKQDFFGKETFLTVSGQLGAEAYCSSMSKVYTFGPTFRAENSNTTRHLAEFWMIEPEIAFANLHDITILAQNLLRYIFQQVLDKNTSDMDFFVQHINSEVIIRLENLIKSEFAYMTYTQAINELLNTSTKFENPIKWGIDLASEHERWLCEQLTKKPTIVTDYPKEIKAFYMRQNADNKTVAAMDVLAPGIGEIIGGSQREERYDVLVARMQALNMQPQHLEWYLDLRRFGSVPHAGFGIGLERLVSYITGVQNIRDVIPFPRSSKSANF